MKAIILAAGYGSRLRPITDNLPKCMVEVNNVKIIEKQLSNLIRNGIELKDIIVVTGYKSDKLKNYINEIYQGVNIVENKVYESTNNMYSLYLTKEYVKDDNFILMNADVYYEEAIIKELLENDFENLIVCDDGIYIEESMKIVKNGNVITNISKAITKEDAYGVSIDVYKLSKQSGKKLFSIIDKIINVDKNLNSWTEVALDMLLKEEEFHSLDIKYNWVEIDNHEDLKHAEELF